MYMIQTLANSELNQNEMNMSQNSTKTRDDHTEINYSKTDNYSDLYEYPGQLLPSLLYHPAHLILLLLVSCLGFVTNTISAMVWFAKVKSKTGAFFLGCLSGVDASFCLIVAVLICMRITDNFTCKYVIVDAIATSLVYTSRILNLPVVAHRWMAISRPLTTMHMFPLHRQVKVQACLVISILPICGGIFYREIFWCGFPDIDLDWYLVWSYYFGIIRFSWNALITICLLVLNTLLLTAACRMKKIVPSHVTVNWQHTVEHRMTVIVLFMSAFSLLDNIIRMNFFFNFINSAKNVLIIKDILSIIYEWALILNSSINFVFYMCFAKDFRLTLLSMCKGVAIRITGDHTHGQEH